MNAEANRGITVHQQTDITEIRPALPLGSAMSILVVYGHTGKKPVKVKLSAV